MDAIDKMLSSLTVLELDDDVAREFGRQFAARPKGITFPPIDLLIASTAIAHDLTLVTHDAHFGRIPRLSVVDWLDA
jgi:tRNA(fMet)-specific endonuclease VapC